MNSSSVSAGYAKALVALAVERGADRKKLADLTGLNLAALDNPDGRIAFGVFKALMRTAKDLCDDPAFGLHFGEMSDFVDMSLVGLICHSAPTMGAAFHEMNRFARLVIQVDGHDDRSRFALTRSGGDLWLEDRRQAPNDFPELTESTFARFTCDTRKHFGDVPFARHIHFTHNAPPYHDEYERIFRVPLTFASDRNAICIHESWLDIPIHKSNPYVFGIFSERAEALMTALVRDTTIRGRVEQMIMPALHTGKVGMDDIADKIGISRISLYRRLKDEGTSFERVLDGLRHQLAQRYLADSKLSVNEVAYLVGFSDPAPFSRAFKRWTGSSPSQFARQPAHIEALP